MACAPNSCRVWQLIADSTPLFFAAALLAALAIFMPSAPAAITIMATVKAGGFIYGGLSTQDPFALVADPLGNLYGVTNFGDIFEVARGSTTAVTLASLTGQNGGSPSPGLAIDSAGNLYGTAPFGGTNDDGTIFELAKGSSSVATAANFSSSTGAGPLGCLIEDANGDLFGVTSGGGANNSGTVFELAKGGKTITTLGSFPSGKGDPSGGLAMDSAGDLFGTTLSGSLGSITGTVFELVKGSSTTTTLATFNGTNGGYPNGGPVIDSAGNLYGTTAFGGTGYNGSNGTGDGTLFEVAKGSGVVADLFNFNGNYGMNPLSGLVADSYGDLYGTTSNSIFELINGATSVTTLANFTGNGRLERVLDF